MAVFEFNVPVTTDTPVVTVETVLKPGTYTFQLVVVDDLGRESAPARRSVAVVKTIIDEDPAPTPVPVDM